MPNKTFKAAKFAAESEFAKDLQQRAKGYFADTHQQERNQPAMYRKTIVIWLWFLASWAALVLLPGPWWLKAPLAVSLGLALAQVVEATARDHGLLYRVQPKLRDAVAAHYQWLRQMGARPVAATNGL